MAHELYVVVRNHEEKQRMARQRPSVVKRQREQVKRERQQLKAAKRLDRKNHVLDPTLDQDSSSAIE